LVVDASDDSSSLGAKQYSTAANELGDTSLTYVQQTTERVNKQTWLELHIERRTECVPSALSDMLAQINQFCTSLD
jgi:hypothetical protein